jgi:hypothetical protein
MQTGVPSRFGGMLPKLSISGNVWLGALKDFNGRKNLHVKPLRLHFSPLTNN